MSISKLFPSKYLKAEDIEDGELVTIGEITVEKVGQAQEEKPVIHFAEHKKGVILNVTNAKAIAKLYGDEEDDWKGKKLTLMSIPSRTPSGEPTMSISMKPVAAPRKTKAATNMAAALNDEVPF
jgi:hypothetical protein